MCYIVDGFDEGNKEKYWAMWECDLRTRLRNLISNFLLAYESIKIVATLMSTPLRVCLFVSLYPYVRIFVLQFRWVRARVRKKKHHHHQHWFWMENNSNNHKITPSQLTNEQFTQHYRICWLEPSLNISRADCFNIFQINRNEMSSRKLGEQTNFNRNFYSNKKNEFCDYGLTSHHIFFFHVHKIILETDRGF